MTPTGPEGRAEILFREVFGLPPGARRARLDGLRRTEPEAVAEVEAVLAFEPDPEVRRDLASLPRLAATMAVEAGLIPPGLHGFDRLTPLAMGGHGVVCQGVEKTLGGHSAIKLIRIPEGASAERRRAVLEEARAQRALRDCPHVVHVNDAFEQDGWLAIVMDLADGGSLRESRWLARARRDQRWAVEAIRDVAEGVGKAQERGFLHLDIKPENILLDRSGKAKIGDFSLSLRIDDAGAGTGARARGGTPGYASPEQVAGAEVSAASDVFSLAVVLVEIAAGVMPLPVGDRGRGPTRALLRSRLDRSLAADLAPVLVKALSREPADRFATATEFAGRLQAVLQGDPKKTWARRAAHSIRRRSLPIIAGLLAIALGVFPYRWRAEASRRAENVRRVEALLDESARSLGEARRDPDSTGLWGKVLAPLPEARLRAGAVPDRPDLLLRCREIARVVRLGEAESRLPGLLRAARMAPAASYRGEFHWAEGDRAYAAAFASHLESDLLGLTPADRALAIDKMRASRHRALLASGLVEWMIVRMKAALVGEGGFGNAIRAGLGDCQVLRESAASLADPADAWERRFFAAFGSPFAAFTLARMARDADVESTPTPQIGLLGEVLFDLNPVAGVRFLRRAQVAHPNDFWISYLLTLSILESDRPDMEAALRFIGIAESLLPPDPILSTFHGAILARMTRYDEAIERWRSVLKKWPDAIHARANLARALVYRDGPGDLDAAGRVIAEAPGHQATAPPLKVARADLLMASRNGGEAIPLFRAAIASGVLIDAHERLKFGRALLEFGDIDGAREQARKLKFARPRDAESLLKDASDRP